MYPGMVIAQLEPGPLSGWMYSCSVRDVQINIGTLDRAVLLEGYYTRGMVNIGFILDPDSTAQVQGHTYDSGAISIDIDDEPMHEVFPGNMIWGGITGPKSMLLKGIDPMPKTRHLTLKGPRGQLAPLLALTERCLGQTSPLTHAEAGRLASRFLDAIRTLIVHRLADSPREHLYPEGDKFRMFIVDCCRQLEAENTGQALALDEICRATRINRRTLQHYFKQMYGMGPTEYFRIRRLNGVRNDLLKAQKDEVTVIGIAEQWGFSHMGRFSQAYTRLFAEHPSETLARLD
jgi:AraC-like DNA-binding protein